MSSCDHCGRIIALLAQLLVQYSLHAVMQEPCYTNQPDRLFRRVGKAWELHRCLMHRLAGL